MDLAKRRKAVWQLDEGSDNLSANSRGGMLDGLGGWVGYGRVGGVQGSLSLGEFSFGCMSMMACNWFVSFCSYFSSFLASFPLPLSDFVNIIQA